ncbi:flagellar hook capping FlgD N-terminal domain-containing protein [Breoghania sp. JC706]|uniref:flagellar hook assembly protein FlgD n=1 Tax=Breoghania sp. JC706 TaxID=3117732 RepID=UPI00300BF4A3
MVSGISGSSSASGTSTPSSGTNALTANYEMFLTLLTTQLQVQDPLDPMKAQEFTNQLVQYSSVEQQVKMNASMDTLISKVNISNATNLVNYIGKQITATGEQSVLTDGFATWKFDAAAAADDVEVTISNSQGAVLYTDKIDVAKGAGAYVWDGRTTSGVTAPDGAYSISFTAKDAKGAKVEVTTESTGVVDGIDFSGSDLVLKMGDVSVPLTTVTSVSGSL